MKPEDFVKAVFDSAYKSGIQSVIEVVEDPPGRQPRPELLRLSSWYLALSDAERTVAQQLMRHSADAAIFGFLAMVDGVRVFDDEQSDIEIQVGGVEVSERRDLHEIFRALVDEDEYS